MTFQSTPVTSRPRRGMEKNAVSPVGGVQQQHQPGTAQRDRDPVDPLGGDQHVGDGEDRDGGDGGHEQLPGRRRQGGGTGQASRHADRQRPQTRTGLVPAVTGSAGGMPASWPGHQPGHCGGQPVTARRQGPRRGTALALLTRRARSAPARTLRRAVRRPGQHDRCRYRGECPGPRSPEPAGVTAAHGTSGVRAAEGRWSCLLLTDHASRPRWSPGAHVMAVRWRPRAGAASQGQASECYGQGARAGCRARWGTEIRHGWRR